MVTLTISFPPEGHLLHSPENQAALATPAALQQSMAEGKIVEGSALLCDAAHSLTVALGPWTGVIPRIEVLWELPTEAPGRLLFSLGWADRSPA